jgi:hypothetical protein
MNSLVRDMMTTDVVTVEPSTPFREIVSAADRASSRRRTSRSSRSTRTPTWTSRWSGPGAVASSGGRRPGRWRSGVARQVHRLAGQRGERLASTLR